MKVGIIGAGFGGLAAAYRLAKRGIDVTIFEADDKPGGLAVGFKKPEWRWPLERHYHHWFTSDWAIRNLGKDLGHKVVFTRAKTSTYINGKVYQLDSPVSLLRFGELSFPERLRTGLVLTYLRSTSNWKSLESQTSEEFIKKHMGQASWKILWEPLFEGKFHDFASKIPASWFWARIKKRSAALGYPKGGFGEFAWALDKKIRELGGSIYYKTPVERITKANDRFLVKTVKNSYEFYRLICTLPSALFVRITQDLPEKYKESLTSLKAIGAVNLILCLNKEFLTDGTYWLNINARHFPFLAIVEHTNFMDKKYYNNEHLVYVGNYLPHEHEYFRKEAFDLLREFYPYLKTINPKFDKSWINSVYLFRAPFAQPIIPLNYSKVVPDFKTPIEGLYLSNIQQVYPWDRGTNYAVENGLKVADFILKGQ